MACEPQNILGREASRGYPDQGNHFGTLPDGPHNVWYGLPLDLSRTCHEVQADEISPSIGNHGAIDRVRNTTDFDLHTEMVQPDPGTFHRSRIEAI